MGEREGEGEGEGGAGLAQVLQSRVVAPLTANSRVLSLTRTVLYYCMKFVWLQQLSLAD
jgi:hypothetical protein